ncbi:uncharacterized protein BCR38DRAFT_507464 [Pseudomassariella vexata]|uniref:Uncharacterized protein n=1 Tax=Pseudomassariella vexata TaxID=1141098 RepID=A0A1Y2ECG7_9PEZI|nr:uncharacterized protein BCR38DRAFT_507464 [Pseudomassariella vexata]ORY68525.1 hypothetical protein BCR38DRAFT_507464 [Pseudomassariella vexata]
MAQSRSAAAKHQGLHLIHVAYLRGDEETVIKELRRNHRRLYERTRDRSTPLMLAALMGHDTIVKLLLKEGGVRLQRKPRAAYHKAEDSQGLRALDYAEETQLMKRKRFHFLRHNMGSEHPLAIDRRAEIRRMLSMLPRALLQLNNAEHTSIFIGKSGSKILTFALVDVQETGQTIGKQKTPALIKVRSENLALKYTLSGTKFDNGAKKPEPEHQGRFLAGHCEPQLSSWSALESVRVLHNKPKNTSISWLVKRLGTLRGAILGDARNIVIQIDDAPYTPGSQRRDAILPEFPEMKFVPLQPKVKGAVFGTYEEELDQIGFDNKAVERVANKINPERCMNMEQSESAQALSSILSGPNYATESRYPEEDDEYESDATMTEEYPTDDASAMAVPELEEGIPQNAITQPNREQQPGSLLLDRSEVRTPQRPIRCEMNQLFDRISKSEEVSKLKLQEFRFPGFMFDDRLYAQRTLYRTPLCRKALKGKAQSYPYDSRRFVAKSNSIEKRQFHGSFVDNHDEVRPHIGRRAFAFDSFSTRKGMDDNHGLHTREGLKGNYGLHGTRRGGICRNLSGLLMGRMLGRIVQTEARTNPQ